MSSTAADAHLASLHQPALEQDSRTAWCRLYHEARGVQRRMEAENERLQAEVKQLRADLAAAESASATGLEFRGG